MCPKCQAECVDATAKPLAGEGELKAILAGLFSMQALDRAHLLSSDISASLVTTALTEIALLRQRIDGCSDLTWLPLHLQNMWLPNTISLLSEAQQQTLRDPWRQCLMMIERKIRSRAAELVQLVKSNPRLEASDSAIDTQVWESWHAELGSIIQILSQKNFMDVHSTLSSDERNSTLAACADAMSKTKPPLPANGEDFDE